MKPWEALKNKFEIQNKMDKIVYIPVTSFFCLAESHSPVLASLISIPSDPRLPESLQIGLFWVV